RTAARCDREADGAGGHAPGCGHADRPGRRAGRHRRLNRRVRVDGEVCAGAVEGDRGGVGEVRAGDRHGGPHRTAGRREARNRGRRRGGGGVRGGGLRREIPRGVIGGDGVGVRRGRSQARVRVGGRGGRGNLSAAAVDAVAAHAHIIRRGRPREIDLRGGDGGGREPRGHRRRRGVGGRAIRDGGGNGIGGAPEARKDR